MRWLVGDVQGCARELDDFIEHVRLDTSRDELWCLGDLVNRGPDSLAALTLLRDVGGKALLGNHDVYALLAFDRRVPRKKDTLEDLFSSPEAHALFDWMLRWPVIARLEGVEGGRPVRVVHAGLDPRWTDLDQVSRSVNEGPFDHDRLRRPDLAFATRVRCCTEDGRSCRHTGRPEECPEPFRPWDSFYEGEDLVVHGHWARRGAYRGRHTIGLDDGCVYGGWLAGWCVEEDRMVRLPSRERGGPVRVDLGGR